MADVTSGLLSVHTAARFQLTAIGESPTRDNNDEDDCTKTLLSSSSSETEDHRSPSSDFSLASRRNCWWSDGPPRRSDDDDHGSLGRLAADSAVGRLALMIQRFAANNQRDIPVPAKPASSHLYQATPSRPLMTSSSDVTSSGDRTRYFCHVCSYVGKSLCVCIDIRIIIIVIVRIIKILMWPK